MNNNELIEFIKNNHETMTARGMGKHLDIHYGKILYHAKKHNICFSKAFNNAKIEQFIDITDPVIAYFLGFLWADGSLSYKIRKERKTLPIIRIEIIKTDADELKKLINNKITFGAYDRHRKGRQKQTQIVINDVKFAQFLIDEWNFDKKSEFFPNILNKLNQNMLPYFLRGYLDGDGFVADHRIEFAASYDFDWTNFYLILEKMQISNIRLCKYISNKGHKHSSIRLNKKEAVIFLNNIYSGEQFGLSRKLQKFLDYHKSL